MKHKKPKCDFIKVRVTDEEKKILQFHASQLNTTISEVVRNFVIFKDKAI